MRVDADELAALREQWRCLCRQPERDDVATALLEWFRRDVAAAREASLAEGPGRAAAMGRMLRGALVIQWMRERRPVRPGPYVVELRRRLVGDVLDEDDAPSGEDPPSIDPGDPFFAWRLSALAEAVGPAERAAVIDRAIEAFSAIALAPIDPGNDPGPFARLAHWMDEAQVRRAIAVSERMATADWRHQLSEARAHLFVRLAALGRVDEAERLLPAIGDAVVRADAHGQILGARVALGEAWSLPESETWSDDSLFLRFVVGLTQVLEPPERTPPEALIRGCLDRACSLAEVELRSVALQVLVDSWHAAGPVELWFSRVREHAGGREQIEMLLLLAAQRASEPEARAIARLALERLATPAGSREGLWFDELWAAREVVAPAEAAAVFAAVMWRAATDPRAWLLPHLHHAYDLAGFLCWIGGEEAIGACVQGLDEAAALLA
ncbi:hypothetical protein [Nannocystis punicea]|uniref:Uncharacterized protein n=1 Tax=Nannocystis punicea TaxID=2995304 RepID=A0ABY7GUT4_9BACT|nr:hypothetical protein [Nannocystis poenicansa]WAS90698.1 hypothetical protein O0S08_31305 [Nannocystis poenicansa]